MYNEITKSASTTSPYFTPEFIDAKCYECVESSNPQTMTVACDICKTLTVTEITQLGYFDILYLLFKFLVGFFIIYKIITFRKKR